MPSRKVRNSQPSGAVLTPSQATDCHQFQTVLEKVRVRGPVGWPRTRPGAVTADKAHSSKTNRAYLRRRGITAVITEKAD
ncbi:transposase [Kitasatospora sp. NPDC056327]|uniref:transposase n=1 Tax=Kitasatospora sp. NPDC056327 TaxID=3345785 RepID=UPI0035D93514